MINGFNYISPLIYRSFDDVVTAGSPVEGVMTRISLKEEIPGVHRFEMGSDDPEDVSTLTISPKREAQDYSHGWTLHGNFYRCDVGLGVRSVVDRGGPV